MATHSSILAWRIPKDRGAWQATVHRVTMSWTQLKWLSMHIHSVLFPTPREHGALWLLPSKPKSSTDLVQAPLCCNSIFTILWRLHHWGSRGPGITDPQWYIGTPNACSPNVTQRVFASVAGFQKYLQEWHLNTFFFPECMCAQSCLTLQPHGL